MCFTTKQTKQYCIKNTPAFQRKLSTIHFARPYNEWKASACIAVIQLKQICYNLSATCVKTQWRVHLMPLRMIPTFMVCVCGGYYYLPLATQLCISHCASPPFTPGPFNPPPLSSSHPNLNNLHPGAEKQLDNKSRLKGRTPTLFTWARHGKQWKRTVKRPGGAEMGVAEHCSQTTLVCWHLSPALSVKTILGSGWCKASIRMGVWVELGVRVGCSIFFIFFRDTPQEQSFSKHW